MLLLRYLTKKEVKLELSTVVLEIRTSFLSNNLKMSENSQKVVDIIENYEKKMHSLTEENIQETKLKEIKLTKDKLVTKLSKVTENLAFLNEETFVHSRLENSLNGSLFNTEIDENIKRDKIASLRQERELLEVKIKALEVQSAEIARNAGAARRFNIDKFLENFKKDEEKAKEFYANLLKQSRILHEQRQEREKREKEKRFETIKEEQEQEELRFSQVRNENRQIVTKLKEQNKQLEMKVKNMKELEQFDLEKKKTNSNTTNTVDKEKLKRLKEKERQERLDRLKKRNEAYKIYTNRELPGIPKQLKEKVTEEVIEHRKLKLKEIQEAELQFSKSEAYKKYEEMLEMKEKEVYNKLYNLNMKKAKGKELTEKCLNEIERDEEKVQELENLRKRFETVPFNQLSKEEREAHFKRKVFDKVRLVKMTEELAAKKFKWKVDLAKSRDFLKPIEKLEEKSSRARSSRQRQLQYMREKSPLKFYEELEEEVEKPTQSNIDPREYLRHRREMRKEKIITFEGN